MTGTAVEVTGAAAVGVTAEAAAVAVEAGTVAVAAVVVAVGAGTAVTAAGMETAVGSRTGAGTSLGAEVAPGRKPQFELSGKITGKDCKCVGRFKSCAARIKIAKILVFQDTSVYKSLAQYFLVGFYLGYIKKRCRYFLLKLTL